MMELASMLAGETFTDHPASVCPVIGSFLRSYNDSIDDRRRQSLYEYAVARWSAAAPAERIQEARAERLATWADEVLRTRRTWFLRSPLRALARLRRPPIDAIGPYAVHAIPKHTDQTHAAALALVDDLLTLAIRDDRVSARVVAARTHALDPAV